MEYKQAILPRTQQPVQTNVKQGGLLGAVVCLGLGATIMLWIPLLGVIFYVPLYLAAFVLSIVAMSQGRIAGGISCLLLTIIMPPIMWMAGMAVNHSPDIQPPPKATYTPRPVY